MFFHRGKKERPFINKRYQIRLVSYFCGSMIAVALISMVIFYFYTYKELGSTYYQSLFTLHGLRQNLLPAMILTGGIAIIFATLTVLAITLIWSHKIAGPVYRLEKSLESVGNGDMSVRIGFRKHDAIDRLAEDINSSIDNLNTKILTIIKHMPEIKEETKRLRENPGRSPATLLEKIRSMKKEAEGLKTKESGV